LPPLVDRQAAKGQLVIDLCPKILESLQATTEPGWVQYSTHESNHIVAALILVLTVAKCQEHPLPLWLSTCLFNPALPEQNSNLLVRGRIG
jgi:hypothetical protein